MNRLISYLEFLKQMGKASYAKLRRFLIPVIPFFRKEKNKAVTWFKKKKYLLILPWIMTRRWSFWLILFLIFLDLMLLSSIMKKANTNPSTALTTKKASCIWDKMPEATAYHYRVTETGSKKVISEGNTILNKASFIPAFGKRYYCSVEPLQICLK